MGEDGIRGLVMRWFNFGDGLAYFPAEISTRPPWNGFPYALVAPADLADAVRQLAARLDAGQGLPDDGTVPALADFTSLLATALRDGSDTVEIGGGWNISVMPDRYTEADYRLVEKAEVDEGLLTRCEMCGANPLPPGFDARDTPLSEVLLSMNEPCPDPAEDVAPHHRWIDVL